MILVFVLKLLGGLALHFVNPIADTSAFEFTLVGSSSLEGVHASFSS